MKSLLLIAFSLAASLSAQISVTPSNSIPNGSVGDTQLVPNTSIGLSAIRVAHATYSFAVDGGGAPGLITPASNFTLPAKSTVWMVAINWTTPATGALNTTSFGLSGSGGGAAVILGATAVASLTGKLSSLVLPTVATGWITLPSGGSLTLTSAVAALTGGVCEVYVFYFVSST